MAVNHRPTHHLMTPVSQATRSTPKHDLRLRLMTFLAMYDLLPYSISHPPNDEEPLELGGAVDERALLRCLQTMARQGMITAQEANALSTLCKADLQKVSFYGTANQSTH